MTLQFVAVLVVMVWAQVVGGVRVPAVAWLSGLVTMVGISLVVEAWVWGRVDLIGIASGMGIGGVLGRIFPVGRPLGWAFASR